MALNGNEWQSLVPLAEWQADILLFLPLSSRRLRMPLYAIKGASPNVIQCHKSKSFPFSRSIRKLKVFRFNPATQAFPPSHLGKVCKHPLRSVWRRFRFLAPTEKQKFSAFRFPFSVFYYLCKKKRLMANG